MSRFLATALLVTAAPLVATGGDADVKKEMSRLQGDWKRVKTEDNNNNAFTGGDPILIEGDKLSIVIRGRITFIGKVKVDPKATPKTIDFEYTEGPGGVVGKIKRGIYKLDKDRLEICWNSDGDKNRPKKFTTKVTTGRGFLHEIFERSKDD